VYLTTTESGSRLPCLAGALPEALLVAEPRQLYRPRHPERQAVYKVTGACSDFSRAPPMTPFTLDGEPSFDTDAVERLFRALLLERLHRAERLSSDFHARLLQWCPSGFSVFAQQIIEPEDTERLEHIARYIARPPTRIDHITWLPDGKLNVTTPPDPRTGKTHTVLDPIDLIHALTTQIPDARSHVIR